MVARWGRPWTNRDKRLGLAVRGAGEPLVARCLLHVHVDREGTTIHLIIDRVRPNAVVHGAGSRWL